MIIPQEPPAIIKPHISELGMMPQVCKINISVSKSIQVSVIEEKKENSWNTLVLSFVSSQTDPTRASLFHFYPNQLL